MKRLVLFIMLLSMEIFSQGLSTPSGYTTTYRLRLYAQKAMPGADSLNANLTQIDNGMTSIRDSMRLSYTYTNTIRNAFSDTIDIIYNYIDTKTTGTFVNLDSAQTISGAKTFSDVTINGKKILKADDEGDYVVGLNVALSAPAIPCKTISADEGGAQITSISAGSEDQEVTIWNLPGYTVTMVNGSNLVLSGGTCVLTGNSMITLVYSVAQSKWVEKSRSLK